MLDRAEATQILEIIDIDMPVVDLIAAPAQQLADHVLARTFRAAGRGNRDKIHRGGELRVEPGIDGVKRPATLNGYSEGRLLEDALRDAHFTHYAGG